MDESLLQRNLSTLEERYRELSEAADQRLQELEAAQLELTHQISALNQQLASQGDALAQAQAHGELQAIRVIELEAALACRSSDYDAMAREKDRISLRLDGLQQRLGIQQAVHQRLRQLRHSLEFG